MSNKNKLRKESGVLWFTVQEDEACHFGEGVATGSGGNSHLATSPRPNRKQSELEAQVGLGYTLKAHCKWPVFSKADVPKVPHTLKTAT